MSFCVRRRWRRILPAYIFLAPVREYGYHPLTLAQFTGYLDGCKGCGTGGDANNQALLPGKTVGHIQGIFVAYGNHLVNNIFIKELGWKTRAQTMDAVCTWFTA